MALHMTDNIVRLPDDAVGCVDYEVGLPPGREGDRRAAVHRHNGAVVFGLDRFALTPSSLDLSVNSTAESVNSCSMESQVSPSDMP